MSISYLDGSRLRRALVAGCEFVQSRRAELNRINVFPVPDGDTGTNLALTAAGVAEELRALDESRLDVVSRQAADAAILGARGNCGMILSHFLLGFSDAVRDRERVNAPEFAAALTAAAGHVYRSLERPVEGTIITVMREVAEEATRAATQDFGDLLEMLLVRARDACRRTPDLLPALRQAGVVDAGALGFVHLMEGIGAYVNGDPFLALEHTPVFDDVEPAAARAEYPQSSEIYRFCTEALVRGSGMPESDVVRDVLRDRGDSMIVIRGAGVLKIHIHTDDPDGVFAYLRSIGTVVTHKAEDMAAQHAAVERSAANHVQLARRPISIVTDSSCDLPEEILRAHGIHLVPLMVVFENEALRDRIDIDAPTFVRRLIDGEHPTTSQPPPRAFIDAFLSAGEDGETVLAIILSSALSGTFGSAEAAAKRMDGAPVVLVDSLGASLTLGLLVLKAAELAELGRAAHVIADELHRIRAQSGILFTVDVFDNLLASGRVGRGQVMIAGLLDIRPILALGPDGTVQPIAKVRGRAHVAERMLATLRERIPADARALRFGVVHVGCAEKAEAFAADLRRTFGEREIIITPASPVLATHLGPGAWGVAYQLED
ncbi:MAG TPA: DegV family protein [Longimicrobiales bacterium]|nr:DegV family protein [Longimicrobiales bacterium]